MTQRHVYGQRIQWGKPEPFEIKHTATARKVRAQMYLDSIVEQAKVSRKFLKTSEHYTTDKAIDTLAMVDSLLASAMDLLKVPIDHE